MPHLGSFQLLFISLSTFAALCSLSSTSMTLRTRTLNVLLWSHRSMRLSSFFFSLFPFCGSDWVISVVLYSSSPVLSSDPLFCSWTYPLSFLFHLFYSSCFFCSYCFFHYNILFLIRFQYQKLKGLEMKWENKCTHLSQSWDHFNCCPMLLRKIILIDD